MWAYFRSEKEKFRFFLYCTPLVDIYRRPLLKRMGQEKLDLLKTRNLTLTAKFRLGEQTGLKLDPAAVARSMMCAKAPDGNLLFTSDDFLTAKQILGFFSHPIK